MHTDAVIPFVFESLPARGAIVQLGQSTQRMLQDHDYEPAVLDVLGHAAAATVLIAQSLKYDSAITLQISGNGPLSMLVMQCNSALEFRGMASAAGGTEGLAFADLVSSARCAITVEAGAMERQYQGIVEVSADSLASSIEGYYERSAQIPSHLQLIAGGGICGGILLQQMPDKLRPESDDWHRLGLLASTLRASDLGGGVGPELLAKLFAEDDLRVFEPRPVSFRCRCSRQRAAEVLKLLGEAECLDAFAAEDRLDVTCEYCGRRQAFDAVDLAQLFADQAVRGTGAIH